MWLNVVAVGAVKAHLAADQGHGVWLISSARDDRHVLIDTGLGASGVGKCGGALRCPWLSSFTNFVAAFTVPLLAAYLLRKDWTHGAAVHLLDLDGARLCL